MKSHPWSNTSIPFICVSVTSNLFPASFDFCDGGRTFEYSPLFERFPTAVHNPPRCPSPSGPHQGGCNGTNRKLLLLLADDRARPLCVSLFAFLGPSGCFFFFGRRWRRPTLAHTNQIDQTHTQGDAKRNYSTYWKSEWLFYCVDGSWLKEYALSCYDGI